VTFVLY